MFNNAREYRKDRLIAFNLFIFFAAAYLLTFSGNASVMEDVRTLRVDVASSIVERLDLAVPDGIRGADGREYSWFPIGSSLLAIPFCLIGKSAGVPSENIFAIMNLLVCAATPVLVFLFASSLGYSNRASLYTSVLYGIGTMSWYYSKDPGDHALETFFVLLSVYFMWRHLKDKTLSSLIFSALYLGMAFIIRPTSILVIPPLLILMISQYPEESDFKARLRFLMGRGALFFLFLLPFVGLFFWYNYCRFGTIFETGYGLMAARLGFDFFTGTPILTGLLGFVLSPGKGFFYYSPVAVLFFFSINIFRKTHPLPAFCFILIILLYLFFYSRNIYWHGDWAWGPRYIFITTPFLILPIAALFDSPAWQRKTTKLFICALLAVSILIQLASVSVNPLNYFIHLQLKENVKFTAAEGEGVLPILEPPSIIYFDWRKSPIIAQFISAYEIIGNLKDFKYSEPSRGAPFVEEINSQLSMNVLDFWWLYRYFIDGSYLGFISPLSLLLIAVFSASRVWKVAHKREAVV